MVRLFFSILLLIVLLSTINHIRGSHKLIYETLMRSAMNGTDTGLTEGVQQADGKTTANQIIRDKNHAPR